MKKTSLIFNIKSLAEKEEERILTGIATTKNLDRVNDIVLPDGVNYTLPLPLLLQHDHNLPVGEVYKIYKTNKGLEFEAKIAKIEEPGKLKDRVDEAWQSVKNFLIKNVSIGFSSEDYITNKSGGLTFNKSDLYEISLVTIPANKDAKILNFKNIDSDLSKQNKTTKIKSSDLLKQTNKQITKINQENTKMKKIYEQIKTLKKQIADNTKKLNDLTEKSIESGETFDEVSQETFDELTNENTNLLNQVKRLEKLEELNKLTANEVNKDQEDFEDDKTSIVKNYAQPKNNQKSYSFVKAVRSIALAKGNGAEAVNIATEKYKNLPQVKEIVQYIQKANSNVASTSSDSYLGLLTPSAGRDISEFLDFVSPLSIVGQLNIPQIGFYSRWAEQLTTANAFWTAEGAKKGVTDFTISDKVLLPLKVANIAVLTEEIIADSTGVKADMLAEKALGQAIASRLDIDMFDPAKAEVAGVSPASFTNGLTPLVSTGTAKTDIRNLVRAVQTTAKTRDGIVLIVDDLTLQDLLDTQTDLGVDVFKDLATSGTIGGIRVISSGYLRQFATSAGGIAICLKEDDFRIAQDPGLSVRSSTEASVYVSTDGATNLRNLFQENLLAVLVEKRINWTKARANSAIAYMTGIDWSPSA